MSISRESQPQCSTSRTRGTGTTRAPFRAKAEANGGAASVAYGALPVLPARTTSPRAVRPSFRELRSALAEGWEIVQPVFARPLWSAPDDSATAFNFVLRRESMTRLVTVPEGRTVQRFIRDRSLQVDYRR